MGKRDSRGGAKARGPLQDSASELGSLEFKPLSDEDNDSVGLSESEEEELPPGGEGDAGGSEEASAEDSPVVSDDSDDAGGSDEEADSDEEEEQDEEEEVEDALLDYAEELRQRGQGGAERGPDDAGADTGAGGAAAGRPDIDAASDSSEDERPNRNTVGNVPLEWYNEEDHIGYDQDGRKVVKGARPDRLEQLLARNDSSKAWRTVYDEYNGEEIVLSKDELRVIQRIRQGRFPHVEVDPFEPENDWFTREQEVMPLSGALEPKRRFVPSKWEEKKVVRLVRALRKGWIKKADDKAGPPDVYLIWEEGGGVSEKTAPGLTYIPAPKLKLPGHEESYNPPLEYLPTKEDLAALEALDPEDRPAFQPTAFYSLRTVPAYANFIKERFERCLDLYLCPRVRRKRIIINDPEELVPQLPKPRDLQPFPALRALRYVGHSAPVRSLASHPAGQWLLTGSDDGTARLWEVATGRELQRWDLGEPVAAVAWSPAAGLALAAAAAGKRVLLLPAAAGPALQREATEAVLLAALGAAEARAAPAPVADWRRAELPGGRGQLDAKLQGLELLHKFPVKSLAWHARGDYFVTVAPAGNTQAVLVHQLSTASSQAPFRRNRGRPVRALFHPTKPQLFVATQQNVRVYDLARQALAKKLVSGGGGVISALDVHPSGDHVLVGSEDRRLAWYDLDLSSTPYRALRYHEHAVRGAAFHRSYPLFASASDDGTAHVFHATVYADLMTNPLIVPLKILRGHSLVNAAGVLDVAFHPGQPWLFTAGADGDAALWVNA